jgi:hypothetical protein
MKSPLLLSLLFFSSQLFAQQVADQTFRLDGVSEHFYAFAEGDTIELRIEELTEKKSSPLSFRLIRNPILFCGPTNWIRY